MRSKFKFNRYFGLHWYQRFDGTYISILLISCLVFTGLVTLLANLDYKALSQKQTEDIRKKYKEFVAHLLIDEPISPAPNPDNPLAVISERDVSRQKSAVKKSTPQSRAAQRKAIEQMISKDPIFADGSKKNTATGSGANLPDMEDYFSNGIHEINVSEITREFKGRWQTASQSLASNEVNNLNAGEYDKPIDNLFNYVVKRRGNIDIDFTDELVENNSHISGYRDPEEVERVVSKYQPMIDHCYRKAARLNSQLRGYVKVRFSISHAGYVIPESIRIIGSTIRSREVEQCIKNYIRRWRNFQPLDESNGIAQVVQKFVFN